MKTVLSLVILLWISLFPLLAEETVVTVGMSADALEATLAKNAVPHGIEYALQLMPPKGCEDVFCELDEETILVVAVSKEKKVIESLVIHRFPKNPRDKADRIFLHPQSVTLTPSTYSLVFSRNENHALAPTLRSAKPAASAPVAPAMAIAQGDSIALEGRFERVWAYGPPNYGENPESDQVIRYYVLILKKPLAVTEKTNREERAATRIRLIPIGAKTKEAFPHIENGAPVRVSGTVRLSSLGIELESVLIDVTDVSVRDSRPKE
ncbi:MAG: hypothetical protein QM790_18815 [Nibricoccus sp.]